MKAFSFGARMLLLSIVPCWNSKTEEEMVSPIFLCHKIKDGGYNNTNINEQRLRLPPIRSLES